MEYYDYIIKTRHLPAAFFLHYRISLKMSKLYQEINRK